MTAHLISRDDLDFLLHDWLRIDDLFDRPLFADHDRQTTASLLDLAAELAEAEFLPHYKAGDRQEPSLTNGEAAVLPGVRAAVKAYVEAGFCAGSFPQDLGGAQLPYVIHSAAMAYVMAANIAAAAYPMLSIGNGHLIATFGSPAQIDAFVRPQLDGRALGTMCLSEPQAGSSLADITTRAEPDGEDEFGARHRLFGAKMWISGGDHDITDNIVHLVLAKTPGPDGRLAPGTRAISLFIVPKVLPDGQRNDVVVAGLNHKMGYRATTNCLLNLGEGDAHRPDGSAGAVGWRVGEPGDGLRLMFHMMNEARIGVGLGAGALAYRAYLLSVDYARERLQGRPVGSRDPAAPPSPIIDHTDVRLMLLAQKAYAEGSLALSLYCARLVDDQASAATEGERIRAGVILGLLTPVAKTWPSEWGLAACDLAIQVHGGYGYTRDFDVEQLYRDNRLNAIHEGTTGIQAIDLLGRKILRDQTGAWDALADRIHATIGQARPFDDLRGHALDLGQAWAEASEVVEVLIDLRDEPRALWNATAFLRAFGHIVAAWLWLDQAVSLCVSERSVDEPFVAGKLRACRYVYECELPKVDPWLAQAKSTSDVAAGMPRDAF